MLRLHSATCTTTHNRRPYSRVSHCGLVASIRYLEPAASRTLRVYSCSEVQKRLTHQSPLRLDERSVLAVHLVVEAAGVAEVVAGAVSPP